MVVFIDNSTVVAEDEKRINSRYINVMTENTRIKRLRFCSWHRGCKETDLVLGPFSDNELSKLSGEEIDLYEKLLDEDDGDIWKWITGADVPEQYSSLIEKLQKTSEIIALKNTGGISADNS